MRKEILKNCLETMRFLSRTTDEVMYLCDLDGEKLYFADNYTQKLNILQTEGTEYTLKQAQQFLFSKNGKRAFFNPGAFEKLADGMAYQEYYLLDQNGKTIKIYTTEKIQKDAEGMPLCIIGHVTDIVLDQESNELKRLQQEKSLVEELQNSVKQQFSGFYICYQPVVAADSFRVHGAEARLRYMSPTRGVIYQNQFVPLLEQTGLIAQAECWMLKQVLTQCSKWREYISDFHMNVNLSLVHMQDRRIWDQLDLDLAQLGVPGDALTFEIMENSYMKDHRSFNIIFKMLAQKGVHVAIDNFKTGYSSLHYLKSMAIDEVKLNRKLLAGIQYSAYNYKLLGNLIELAHRSGIRVCCKGVETEEELCVLKELNPDLIQGYLFGKSLSVEEFEANYFDKKSEMYQAARAKEEKYAHLAPRFNRAAQEYARYEKMAAVLDGMDEIIYVSDWETDELLYLNAAGRNLTDIYDYTDRKCYEVMYGRMEPCDFCQKNKAGKDSYYVWELDNDHLKRHFMVKNKQIQWTGKKGNLTVCIDITEKEIMSKAAASKDSLTGVYNRAAFEENVRSYMRKEAENESTLVVLDIDNFKMINDTYGHIEGDAVLQQLVKALRQVFRRHDLIGRFGGDEFLIFLKNLTDKDVISRRLQEFQNLFIQLNQYDATCSMGITTLRKDDFSYTESLNQADIALYRSKEKGKNKFTYYDELGTV